MPWLGPVWPAWCWPVSWPEPVPRTLCSCGAARKLRHWRLATCRRKAGRRARPTRKTTRPQAGQWPGVVADTRAWLRSCRRQRKNNKRREPASRGKNKCLTCARASVPCRVWRNNWLLLYQRCSRAWKTMTTAVAASPRVQWHRTRCAASWLCPPAPGRCADWVRAGQNSGLARAPRRWQWQWRWRRRAASRPR